MEHTAEVLYSGNSGGLVEHPATSPESLEVICTVSAFYNQVKKALPIMANGHNWECLSVFSLSDSTQDEIPGAEELFLLKLYGSIRSKTLKKLRHLIYCRSVDRTFLTSSDFKIEFLPPTFADTKFHSHNLSMEKLRNIYFPS